MGRYLHRCVRKNVFEHTPFLKFYDVSTAVASKDAAGVGCDFGEHLRALFVMKPLVLSNKV